MAIREAVRAEAGETPQIWAAVEDDIRARETLVPEHPVGSFPSAVTPSPVAPSASLPRAANNNRRWMTAAFGALAIAAAVLLVFGLSSDESTIAGLPTPEPVVLVESAELVFASASDVVVENLEYGDDVMVMQMMGDDGAMILWVDEGEVL